MNYYIEVFRNLNGLVTSAFTTYALYEYQFNHNSSLLENNSWVILLNLLIDSTMISSPIVILHHALSLGYCVVLYTHSIEIDMMQNAISIIFSSEISTMFLCVRELSLLHPKTKRKYEFLFMINDVCFALTFFYFRLYLIPNSVFFDPYFFNLYPTSDYSFYLLSYGLIGINVYWSTLIFRGIYNVSQLLKIL